MTGDAADMHARLLTLLPLRWFPDVAPRLTAVLAGLAEAPSWLYRMLSYTKLQTRIATATDSFLDLVAQDYFATTLTRRTGEGDTAFRARIMGDLLRDRATRPALIAALTDLTGRAPSVFEPSAPGDTGGWGVAVGYGIAGGWGSLTLPFQSFVTVRRPLGSGVPLVSGYSSGAGGYGGGTIEYVSAAMVQSQVTDADIIDTVARTIPAATIAWMRIAD
jgi:hypothetical protein